MDLTEFRQPVPRGWTTRRSVPTSEVIGLHPGSFSKLSLTHALPRSSGYIQVPTTNSASPMRFRGHWATSRFLPQTQPHPCTSPVGTESLGPSPARPAAQRADGETPSLPTCRYRPSGPLGPAATSEVGRFLRKRRSGEHDRDAALSMAGTLDNPCHGPSLRLCDEAAEVSVISPSWPSRGHRRVGPIRCRRRSPPPTAPRAALWIHGSPNLARR